jgi:hypothetical protein
MVIFVIPFPYLVITLYANIGVKSIGLGKIIKILHEFLALGGQNVTTQDRKRYISMLINPQGGSSPMAPPCLLHQPASGVRRSLRQKPHG